MPCCSLTSGVLWGRGHRSAGFNACRSNGHDVTSADTVRGLNAVAYPLDMAVADGWRSCTSTVTSSRAVGAVAWLTRANPRTCEIGRCGAPANFEFALAGVRAS